LVITSGACPVHCRYCFRRHFPYQDHTGITQLKQQLRRRLMQDLSINEVILSGGDPLSLDDDTLFELIAVVESISHVKTLRIHTRFPVVIPNRLTSEFISRLANSRLHKVCVFHINHPNEINVELTEKTQRMHAARIHLLNQSVLLKGINDDEQTLVKLSEALWRSSILPYYIHQLDSVDGAAHFAVSDSDAAKLIANLRNQLSGYLVPQLVREFPGAASKTPLYS
ncbi:MAG: KamA family radical SAM protein, partial [Pseudomonadota bacterium]